MHPERFYTARVTNKRGRAVYISPPYPTRDAAEADAFAACPSARSVSSGYGYGGALDIRWTDRPRYTIPAATES